MECARLLSEALNFMEESVEVKSREVMTKVELGSNPNGATLARLGSLVVSLSYFLYAKVALFHAVPAPRNGK